MWALAGSSVGRQLRVMLAVAWLAGWLAKLHPALPAGSRVPASSERGQGVRPPGAVAGLRQRGGEHLLRGENLERTYLGCLVRKVPLIGENIGCEVRSWA